MAGVDCRDQEGPANGRTQEGIILLPLSTKRLVLVMKAIRAYCGSDGERIAQISIEQDIARCHVYDADKSTYELIAHACYDDVD